MTELETGPPHGANARKPRAAAGRGKPKAIDAADHAARAAAVRALYAGARFDLWANHGEHV